MDDAVLVFHIEACMLEYALRARVDLGIAVLREADILQQYPPPDVHRTGEEK